jgi:hypothetical protein
VDITMHRVDITGTCLMLDESTHSEMVLEVRTGQELVAARKACIFHRSWQPDLFFKCEDAQAHVHRACSVQSMHEGRDQHWIGFRSIVIHSCVIRWWLNLSQ